SYLLAEFTNALPPGVSLMDFVMESKRRNPPAGAGASGSGSSGANATFQQRQAVNDAKKKKDTAGATPETKEYDVNMKLTGMAQTDVQVAQFIRKLNESKLLKDVNLVISDEFTKDNESLRKFQIECSLDPKAEVQPGETNKTAAVE